jgi:hypothetical protein
MFAEKIKPKSLEGLLATAKAEIHQKLVCNIDKMAIESTQHSLTDKVLRVTFKKEFVAELARASKRDPHQKRSLAYDMLLCAIEDILVQSKVPAPQLGYKYDDMIALSFEGDKAVGFSINTAHINAESLDVQIKHRPLHYAIISNSRSILEQIQKFLAGEQQRFTSGMSK